MNGQGQEGGDRPLISVIIPVHRSEASIERCVGSVLASKKVRVEVILVDDGSPDRSGEICDELAKEDPRVRVLHQEDFGVSHARNQGLQLSLGDYITFVDADDAVDPGMLQLLLSLITEKDCDIAGCGFACTNMAAALPDTEVLGTTEETCRIYTGEEFTAQRLLRGDSRIWSKLFRSGLLKDRYFPEDLIIGEDMVYLLSLMTESLRICVSEVKGYGYYVNPNGAMERPFTPSYLDQLRCWERAQELVQEKFPELYCQEEIRARLAALQATGILLIAGKLSRLKKEELAKESGTAGMLKEKLKACLAVPGCREYLPEGYREKCTLYAAAPGAYFLLYGTLRRILRKTDKQNEEQNNRIVLYMHAGSGNHGCEAIVTGLMQEPAPASPEEVLLLTNCAQEDQRYLPEGICTVAEEQHIDRSFAVHALYYLYRRVTGDKESFFRYRYRAAWDRSWPSVAVSIGGDNYCYPIMVPDLVTGHAMFRRGGARTVLLGCSIEPALLKSAAEGGSEDSGRGGYPVGELLQDLASYDVVLTRETITYEALKDALGNRTRVLLVPDPAFRMPAARDKAQYPDGFERGRTIGINISPMAEELEGKGGALRESVRALIRHILHHTMDRIALIPHVVWERNDDRKVLLDLYEEMRKELPGPEAERLLMVQDQPARCLKAVIADCRLFIGARTHATIAAYSSCVPTLVIGYSVKAKGIARDLFGGAQIDGETYRQDRYVIPVQELTDPQQLISRYEWICGHEAELRAHLKEFMPDYIRRAEENAAVIRELL